METGVKEIEFNGDRLLVARDSGKVYVGVRWVCDGLGLSEGQSKAERLRIQGDTVLSKGGRKIVLSSNNADRRLTLCIELDYLPLWLAKINANIMKDEQTKEKLVNYQLKAKDVLANAFLQGNAQANTSTFIIPQSYSEALQLSANLQKKIEGDAPKVKQFQEFISARGTQTMNDVAKSLGTGRNRLMKYLRERKVFMENNMPYQRYINAGLFTAKQRVIMGRICVQPFVTTRGISFISEAMV